MFANLKQYLIGFYNDKIVKRWYRSWAMWVGVAAGVVPYLPDLVQTLLDNWAPISVFIPTMTDSEKEAFRLVMLLVVLPIAKALQQKSMHPADEPPKVDPS
jgi:hypothetical protein